MIKRESVKIAVVIGQLAQGGSERQLYAFLKHCDRQRWSPIVFVSRGPMGFWEGPIRDLNIPIIVLQGNAVKRMWSFRKTCSAQQVKRFFSWSSHTNAYALALVGMDVLKIGSFRNDYQHDFPQQNRRLREWASLAGISVAVCNSQETAADVDDHATNGKQVVYVPNSVSLVENVEFHRTKWRQQLGITDDECLVLGVGRLSAQKNFIRFVEAVALVHRVVPIKAVVAGRDDGCLERLLQKATDLGLDAATMRFIGAVPEARELMCAADIFMLSSDYEGMPNVILEAMSAGVPCVSTRVNGVSDLIVSEVNGYVTNHQANALAEKATLLAKDAALRLEMGNQAKERIGSSFNPQGVAERLWRLLE